MPDWCNSMRCIMCESHAIVGGKLDCNYMNRLGLSQPTVKTFLEIVASPDQLEAQIRDATERAKKAKEELEKLDELKKKIGGEKSANLS